MLAHAIDRYNMRMIQPRHRFRLAQKTFRHRPQFPSRGPAGCATARFAIGPPPRTPITRSCRNILIATCRSSASRIVRQIHRPHAPLAQRTQQAIRPKKVSHCSVQASSSRLKLTRQPSLMEINSLSRSGRPSLLAAFLQQEYGSGLDHFRTQRKRGNMSILHSSKVWSLCVGVVAIVALMLAGCQSSGGTASSNTMAAKTSRPAIPHSPRRHRYRPL